jgi:hypothetical protein
MCTWPRRLPQPLLLLLMLLRLSRLQQLVMTLAATAVVSQRTHTRSRLCG